MYDSIFLFWVDLLDQGLDIYGCLWFHVNDWWQEMLYTRGRQRPFIDGQALWIEDDMSDDLMSSFMIAEWQIAATLEVILR